jgi:hypothetical protein
MADASIAVSGGNVAVSPKNGKGTDLCEPALTM